MRILIGMILTLLLSYANANTKIDFCEYERGTCSFVGLDHIEYDLSDLSAESLYDELSHLKKNFITFIEKKDNKDHHFKFKSIEVENSGDSVEKIKRIISAYKRFYINLFGNRFSGESHIIIKDINKSLISGCLKKTSLEAMEAIEHAKSKALKNCSNPGDYFENFEPNMDCNIEMATITTRVADLSIATSCKATVVLHRNF